MWPPFCPVSLLCLTLSLCQQTGPSWVVAASKQEALETCLFVDTLGSVICALQLALKHRQGKNHKMRIIAFVGSPVEDNEKDLVKLAKRLKKEKVNVDIINFGEEEANTDKLTAFINTLNGKDGTGSHLVTVPPGPSLADALISSPILAGEGGAIWLW
ncbi:hypothetical protein llap_22369 [Limosa lapponica baueri]|uniref:VWFA domain-containing protein n=1 Tax=Limosa lapponica baueri TaxID=1758121 RepID=A0A2I0T0K3_LIMLA|nr:hypothetical protein llap_22369 [Limosa lapponica baueri]